MFFSCFECWIITCFGRACDAFCGGCYSDQMSPTLVRLYDDERRKNTAGCDGKVEGVEGEGEEGEEEEGLAYCLTELEACMDHVDDPIRKVAAGYAHSTFLTASGILYVKSL
jgi:hypothetical protein